MRKLAGVLVVGCLAFAVGYGLGYVTPAWATSHPPYALGHAKHCRAHYASVVRHHRVHGKLVAYRECVWHAPKPTAKPGTVSVTVPATTVPRTTTTPVISYKASLDPAFTQSGTDALDVTYTYTADAIETQGAVQIDLAREGTLPGGVLDLYSDGALACSINVGGPTSGGTCEIAYSAFGEQTVVTEYIPNGVAPVTVTETEDIEPAPAPVVSYVVGDPYSVTVGMDATTQWDSVYYGGGEYESYFDWYSPTFTVADTITGQDVTGIVASPVVQLTVVNGDGSTFAVVGVGLSNSPLGPDHVAAEQGVYALSDCAPATPSQCALIDPPPSDPFTTTIGTESGVVVTDPAPTITWGGTTGDQEYETYTTHTLTVPAPVMQSISYTAP
jgi:hypothetical protein